LCSADQRRDAGTDGRVVVFDRNAEALQHGVAEMAGRMVDRIDDERMVACRQESEERHGDGGKARGHEDGAGRAFQLVDRRAERVRRRRAARAVGVFLRPAFHGRRIGKEHGRGVNDGRIDETVVVRRVVSGMGKAGVHAGAGEDFVSVFHDRSEEGRRGFEALTFGQARRQVNPMRQRGRGFQSASSGKDANF
jgi:hypothetical protein